MVEHNKLNDTAIQEWIDSDTTLSNLLLEIEKMSDSIKEQAEIAFHKVSEVYKVAKLPEDNDCDDYEDQDELEYTEKTSVYEQLGLLKYLEPNEDLRGLVLSAIYFVKNGYTTDIDEVMLKKFGENIPNDVSVGFKGDNTNVEIVFILQGQNWVDLGCKMFTKYI